MVANRRRRGNRVNRVTRVANAAAYGAPMHVSRSPSLPRQGVAADRSRSEPHRDASLWSLVGANVISLVVAVAQGWTLIDLMPVYWLQSVTIGASYCARILSLDKFSTEGFKINDRAVAPTRQTKRQTAAFFAIHYGMFHAVYLLFIGTEASPGTFVDPQLWACGLAFAVNHFYSYRYNRDMDRRGTPNIGTLMFTPYLRIVPMHLTIVFGLMASGGIGLVFFGVLKTTADVAMHAVEHRLLARRSMT
jgi:Family of unknown function (DUF6498)